MNYLRLQTAKIHPFLKWFHFNEFRAWVDMTSPKIELAIMLFGRDAADISVRILNNEGKELPAGITALENAPNNLRDFSDQSEKNRQMLKICFSLETSGRHVVVDSRTGDELMDFLPSVVFPDFLFRVIEELRMGFAPEGFANFVETGTLFGHTTLHASYWFDNVSTIELSSELHEQACKNLAHRSNVSCLKGNSGEILFNLASTLSGNTFFFLDGHWSGDNTVDWTGGRFGGYPAETAIVKDSTLSKTQCQKPLESELTAIAENCSGKTAVLMDDWEYLGTNGLGFKGLDWSEINPEKVIEWIDGNERTVFHAKIDRSRYLWCLAPK